MSSKREENINKLIKGDLISPNAFKKKRFRITYANGKQEDDIRTSQTVRKRVDQHTVVSVEMKKMIIDKSSSKKVATETDWKDVTARYKKVK